MKPVLLLSLLSLAVSDKLYLQIAEPLEGLIQSRTVH